jgi:hypothetical protein
MATQAEGRSLSQLERETEHTRAGLIETVDELHNRVSPHAIKAEAKTYVRATGNELIHTLERKARENPLHRHCRHLGELEGPNRRMAPDVCDYHDGCKFPSRADSRPNACHSIACRLQSLAWCSHPSVTSILIADAPMTAQKRKLVAEEHLTVRFIAREILATGVLFFKCAFSSR